jgi:hypothetical protein
MHTCARFAVSDVSPFLDRDYTSALILIVFILGYIAAGYLVAKDKE